jgi:multidrug efflux pump subunit AcrA (membrane-fusion protein)
MNLARGTKNAKRRRVFGALISVGLLATGCGRETERAAQRTEVVPGLRVQRMQLQNVEDELEAPGTVIAVSTAQVAARTMGTVLQVAVREGDNVKRGQVLAQLDERELTSRRSAAQAGAQAAAAGVSHAAKALTAAQAQADVMQKTYERYVYLKEQKSVSPQEFDEISAKQQAAQANLEQVKAAVRQAEAGSTQAESEAHAAESVASYARIVAPFDGRVIRRTVEPGSLVSPGMPLFIVEDASRYQLEATLPAEAAAFLKKNALARVQLDGLQQKSLSGKIAEMEAGADPASHTLKARIDLPRETGVQSGMFGRAFFQRGEKQALLVPGPAFVDRGQLRGIYVLDAGGLLHWRVITVGRNTGGLFEILSGLSDGDVVVLNPGTQELDGKKAAL